MQRHLRGHAADPGTGGTQRTVIDQDKLTTRAAYLAQCVEAGGACTDDGHLGVNFGKHGEGFLAEGQKQVTPTA